MRAFREMQRFIVNNTLIFERVRGVELKQKLWGGHLWNPSYCAVTVSDRSREQVLAYMEGQKEKEKRRN